jgi:predicted amidophosphoribosyltransferase
MAASLAELVGSADLVPVPPARPGWCRICRGTVPTDVRVCYPCRRALTASRWQVADAVSFISLAPKGGALAGDLWRYKSGDPAAAVAAQLRLLALLWRFLTAHERCLAAAAGTAAFRTVCAVPSTLERRAHPLVELLRDVLPATGERYRELLAPSETDELFVPRAPVAGSVLLVDDTWTTGRHAQAAAAALKRAGADVVGTLAVGRHTRDGSAGAFRWDDCCLHVTPARTPAAARR